MGAGGYALLVRYEEKPIADLRPLLEAQGIATRQAGSCGEAESMIARVEPPALIFTDTVLSDGTWANVEGLAKRVSPEVPVIVVSRFVDLRLYLDVLDGGASDFIVPPFRDIDIAHVVKGALGGRFRFASSLARAATGEERS